MLILKIRSWWRRGWFRRVGVQKVQIEIDDFFWLFSGFSLKIFYWQELGRIRTEIDHRSADLGLFGRVIKRKGMMILAPDNFHISAVAITLLKIVCGLYVIAIKVVFHDMVNYLSFWFWQKTLNRAILLYHSLDELFDERLKSMNGDFVQLKIVPVTL